MLIFANTFNANPSELQVLYKMLRSDKESFLLAYGIIDSWKQFFPDDILIIERILDEVEEYIFAQSTLFTESMSMMVDLRNKFMNTFYDMINIIDDTARIS